MTPDATNDQRGCMPPWCCPEHQRLDELHRYASDTEWADTAAGQELADDLTGAVIKAQQAGIPGEIIRATLDAVLSVQGGAE